MRRLPAYGCVLYWLKRLSTAPLRVWRFRDDEQCGALLRRLATTRGARPRKQAKQDPCNEAYLSDEGYLVRAATRPCAGARRVCRGVLAAERGAGYFETIWSTFGCVE